MRKHLDTGQKPESNGVETRMEGREAGGRKGEDDNKRRRNKTEESEITKRHKKIRKRHGE